MKLISSDNKLRGGYYTPSTLAAFLAEWAVGRSTRDVLEPSCGDGNILVEIVKQFERRKTSVSVTGIELTDSEAKKARQRVRGMHGPVSVRIQSGDFFDHAIKCFASGKKYDAVIGNPPFVRYQDFPEEQRTKAFGLMRTMGLNPSKLTNLWMPFLAISAQLLGDKGRLAMVIPAELFQVGYASELRQFLANFFPTINVVAFERLVFPDIQQEVVLLLADRTESATPGIRVHEAGDASSLSKVDLEALAKAKPKPVDHAAEKWTKYFLDRDEILLLRRLRERTDISQLRNFIEVDVGIVTGDNDYFLLSQEEVSEFGLQDATVPVVARSAALAGISFDDRDFSAWQSLGRKSQLFLPQAVLSPSVRRYIGLGENQKVNTGYKCRIRREWYVVPSVWTPDVFFLRQADQSPRMVANHTRATCTDTLHRGRLVDGLDAARLAAAFTNSLTFAASEVTGRSYGGGVMTFEPSEVEKLPLPVRGIEELDIGQIDELIRARKLAEALDVVDRVLLIDGLGLKQREVQKLRGIWLKLMNRRRGRKSRDLRVVK